MDVTIIDEPEHNRFVITVDAAPAGEITYTLRNGVRIVPHVGVDTRFEGRGVASKATAALLDEVRARGEQIVPLCPFVRSYIERNPGYDDLVDRPADPG
ncbi:MAG: GNAT family N-acetyltransferase [Actinomycetota bacterium]